MTKNIILRIVQKINNGEEITLHKFSEKSTALEVQEFFFQNSVHWNIKYTDVLELTNEQLNSDDYYKYKINNLKK
jgi:hypothetical protein